VDGANPFARLIRGKLGKLYGTTYAGGASGWGVVFELDPTGKETVLHSFTGGADGGHPDAGLVGDGAGNFYGTTPYGGDLSGCRNGSGCGVVFELDPTGTETVFYGFTGGANGAIPAAGLVWDAAGNLYGTTSRGGAAGSGVVFKLDPTGKETVLYRFTVGADGAIPTAGLVRDAAGNLYGTTGGGGASNNGVVYKVV
jgi:uncharacterized repeat protein (TIGR03803 family)